MRFAEAPRSALAATDFTDILELRAGRSPVGMSKQPALEPCLALRDARASERIREHRAHLDAHGPISSTHDVGAQMAAFVVARAATARSS